MNPLQKIAEFGQSVWLDDLHRGLILSGRLNRLITGDGLRGVTSNPAIFSKAIIDSPDYDAPIRALREQGKTARGIYETLAVEDTQLAADVFAPLHAKSSRAHGYVSLEVDPHLARDPEGTLEEAVRLWRTIDRPNVFIKVPGTAEALPVITQLISEGVNVNVTLLFGLPRYRQVAGAYLTGLEQRLQRGRPVQDVRSVASFFISRIDVLLDKRLDQLKRIDREDRSELAGELRGMVAIASAKLAYQLYKEITASTRWQKLARQGAAPQQLLWASTSTKDPAYSDLKYVEPLIGPETINTMPVGTLDAFRDHGQPQANLEEGVETARRAMVALANLGIDLDALTGQLEAEGIEKFSQPFDELLRTLAVPAPQATGAGR